MTKLWKKIAEYSNAVGKYGPGSPQTDTVRKTHEGDSAFIMFADALDRVKRGLGGSGIDYAPDAIHEADEEQS